MQPPAALIGTGIKELPCMGMAASGTSGSPSILTPHPKRQRAEALRCCGLEIVFA